MTIWDWIRTKTKTTYEKERVCWALGCPRCHGEVIVGRREMYGPDELCCPHDGCGYEGGMTLRQIRWVSQSRDNESRPG